MNSEASSILVAVRVRPFHPLYEDPLECIVAVPDSKTISISEVRKDYTCASAQSAFNSSFSIEETSVLYNNSNSLFPSTQQRSFIFDKIFWSVPLLQEDFATQGILPSPRGALGDSVTNSIPTSRETKDNKEIKEIKGIRRAPSLHGSSLRCSPREHPSRLHTGAPTPYSSGIWRMPVTSIENGVDNNNNNSNANNLAVGKIGLAKGNNNLNMSSLPYFSGSPDYDDQKAVYDYLGPILSKAAMAGFNSCLFGYGQSGSGKTHSLIGPPRSASLSRTDPSIGIAPRLFYDIFEQIKKEKEEEDAVTYNVECSFYEIYCEKVRDLLSKRIVGEGMHVSRYDNNNNNTSNNNNNNNNSNNASYSYSAPLSPSSGGLRIRQHPVKGPYVEGLSTHYIRQADVLMDLLNIGMKERVKAESKTNDHSSRSHAIIQLTITKITVVNEESTVVTNSRSCKVSIVDLAGSERIHQSGATGERLEEAKNINLSLSTLGRVIQQLSEKQPGRTVFPSYRDSTLTWLLSDSLGGNSKTIMLATVAPSANCYHQTLSTLRFAGIAKKVVNVATVNEDKHFQKLIAELREQVVRLTMRIEEGKASEAFVEENERLQQRNADLQAENNALQAQISVMVERAEYLKLKHALEEKEEANIQLMQEKVVLQSELVLCNTTVRKDLAQKTSEIMFLHDALAKKEKEVLEWSLKFREEARAKSQYAPNSLTDYEKESNRLDGEDKMGSTHSSPLIGAKVRFQATPVSSPLSNEYTLLHEKFVELEKQLKEARQKNSESSKVQRALKEEMDELKVLNYEQKNQIEGLRCRLDGLLYDYSTVTSELNAKNEKSKNDLSASPSQKNSAAKDRFGILKPLLDPVKTFDTDGRIQLELLQKQYTMEKKENEEYLHKISRLELQLESHNKESDQNRNDINDLEQILIEETETSERYYLILCYYSTLVDLEVALRRNLSPSFPKSPHKPPFSTAIDAGAEVNRQTFSSPPDPAVVTCRLPLVTPRLDDCILDEEYVRSIIEQEWLFDALEILRMKCCLREAALSHTKEELRLALSNFRQADTELGILRKKALNLEDALRSESLQRARDQELLQASELSREQLLKNIEAVSKKLDEFERTNSSLVAKLAESQFMSESLQVQCAAAEKKLAEIQEVDTSVKAPVSPIWENEPHSEDNRPTSDSFLQETNHPYATHIRILESQVDHLKRGKEEVVKHSHHELELLRRQNADLTESLKSAYEANRQLAKNYEERFADQEETITALTKMVEEETRSADEYRRKLRLSEAECASLADELLAFKERQSLDESSGAARNKRLFKSEEMIRYRRSIFPSLSPESVMANDSPCCDPIEPEAEQEKEPSNFFSQPSNEDRYMSTESSAPQKAYASFISELNGRKGSVSVESAYRREEINQESSPSPFNGANSDG